MIAKCSANGNSMAQGRATHLAFSDSWVRRLLVQEVHVYGVASHLQRRVAREG